MTYFSKNSPIGVIGAGNVGTALAVALDKSGYDVVSVASRTFASAVKLSDRVSNSKPELDTQKTVDVSKVVFVTTPDDSILSVLNALKFRDGQLIIHCSGVSSLRLFEDANLPNGVFRACFHPIQSFASINDDDDFFEHITIGIEGTSYIKEFLQKICADFGANFVELRPEDKSIYHLSGVLMGGLLSEYVAMCAELWVSFGLSREQGVKALLPMMKQVSNNIEKYGIPNAVAGPFARGDVGTISKHIQAISKYKPDLLPFYCHLSMQGLQFVEEKNQLDSDVIHQMRNMLEEKLEDRQII